MKYDEYGIAFATSDELCDMLYQNPNFDISKIFVTDPLDYNDAVKKLYADLPILKLYNFGNMDVEKFDAALQAHWNMPDEYKTLDIAAHVLDQCRESAELQRAGQELLLYQERDLFDLLRYLKYLVDTMRANAIIWGVGRGSSVSSFVLYLLGVHRINSLHYDLDPTEFLK